MNFTRKLLIVLASVWLLSTAIGIASEAMAFHFQSSRDTAPRETAPRETVEGVDQESTDTFPPYVRLTEVTKDYLQSYPNAADSTTLAVELVRDHIHHLYSGNFDEARKDWHPDGQVLHNYDQYLTRKEKTVQWSNDQPFHRSASQYIDILEKYRQEFQPNMLRPPKKEGPWIHPFSGLALTVLDVQPNGVLIRIDEPQVIDLGEPNSLEIPAPLRGIFGYRSIQFNVQVGSIFEQNSVTRPGADFSDVEFRVRLQHLSLSPAPGC